MGNLLTVIVNSLMQEIVKKIKSLGYHSYDIDFENTFTVDGIRNNPKCKVMVKKSAISAEELFVLENVSVDDCAQFCVELRIPKIVIQIGKAAFTCNDPKFFCGAAGSIQIVDTHFKLIVSGGMTINGLKIESISMKPKVTEIKSEIQLNVNKKDCSELANSVLQSQDPLILNFILEFVLKSQGESIKQLINEQLQEAQKANCSFD